MCLFPKLRKRVVLKDNNRDSIIKSLHVLIIDIQELDVMWMIEESLRIRRWRCYNQAGN